ncbi:MAG: Gx transporter family protein [Oscillospiraceae bacterium]|nr:Gx transporter family protein [Oscillospiraceae bacterium]
MNIRRLTELAMLSTVALIIFVIELRIPNPFPIPGVKLGLANIVTVYAVFRCRPSETAMIVTVRLLLGAMFSGNPSALLYSAAGAVCCLLGMLVLRHILPEKQIWLCSVIGAMLHNIGQITAAVIIMRSFGVIAYLPLLLVTGALAGVFTGICAQLLLKRMDRQNGPLR